MTIAYWIKRMIGEVVTNIPQIVKTVSFANKDIDSCNQS